MRFCIYRVAIGGYVAVKLALAGHEVCVIAREFGHQDFVICALKAHQAYAGAPDFAPLLGPSTAVVTAMNGIPWWYFYEGGGRFEGCRLSSVDLNDRQWNAIGPERAIGCVVEPACEVAEPGVIVHHALNRFILGEPDRSRSPRVAALREALVGAGFEAPVREEVRWNIWLKLWGNVCFNPISALTGATLDRIIADPALRGLCKSMMLETEAVNDPLETQLRNSRTRHDDSLYHPR
jgi:2-dehydropantoate 2-reductase